MNWSEKRALKKLDAELSRADELAQHDPEEAKVDFRDLAPRDELINSALDTVPHSRKVLAALIATLAISGAAGAITGKEAAENRKAIVSCEGSQPFPAQDGQDFESLKQNAATFIQKETGTLPSLEQMSYAFDVLNPGIKTTISPDLGFRPALDLADGQRSLNIPVSCPPMPKSQN
jgi:hypothetical protein